MRRFTAAAKARLLAKAEAFEAAHRELSAASHELTEQELGKAFRHSQCCRVGGMRAGGPSGGSGVTPCPCGADVRVAQPAPEDWDADSLAERLEDLPEGSRKLIHDLMNMMGFK